MRYIIISIFLLAVPFYGVRAEETISSRHLFPAPGGTINTTENAYLAVNDVNDKKVGIGTNTPQSKLDVEGGVAVGAAYSGTSEAPSDGMIIEGDVGIGTTDPGNNKLEVVGGPIKATDGLIIETRGDDPVSPVNGQIWLRTDL